MRSDAFATTVNVLEHLCRHGQGCKVATVAQELRTDGPPDVLARHELLRGRRGGIVTPGQRQNPLTETNEAGAASVVFSVTWLILRQVSFGHFMIIA